MTLVDDLPFREDWDQFSLDQISLLIRLDYNLQDKQMFSHRPENYQIISQLGFDAVISHNIYNDRIYRAQVKRVLEIRLTQLRDQYEAKYHIYAHELDFESIRNQLLSGILSLKNIAALTNPFNIQAVEKYLDLDQTGDYMLLIKNWNHKYYSSQACEVYNTPEQCLLKAIRYNDLENFERLYPVWTPQYITGLAIKEAIRYGRVEILQRILDKGKGHDIMATLLRQKPMTLAATSEFDNSPMLKYLWSFPQIRESGEVNESFVRSITHGPKTVSSNVETLLQISPPHDINFIIVTIAQRGWTRIFKELVQYQEPRRDTWNDSFVYAAIGGHDELVNFIRPHIITPALNIYRMLYDASHNEDALRYVIALPEVTPEELALIISMSDGWHYRDSLIKLARESGKFVDEN